MKNEMLERLKAQWEGISLEVLRREWEEIEAIEMDSPDAYEYISHMAYYHSHNSKRWLSQK